MEIPIEKRFKVLCEIVRSQHFAWREAALALCPGLDPIELTRKMWEITGVQTAQAYVKRIDAARPLAEQVAACIVWSSSCMGEDARVVKGNGDEAFVRHDACPWFSWHEQRGLAAEDRIGCDAWFRSAVEELNRVLGTRLRVETMSALPDRDKCCLRRIWVEK